MTEQVQLREVRPDDVEECARIVFEAFGAIHDHLRSLSLYASLGFAVTASCVVMSGTPRGKPAGGIEVRPLADDDLDECEALSKDVLGFERTGALRDALQFFTPYAALRGGRIVAYASTLTFWPMAHGVAADEEAMTALLAGGAAAAEEPLALLVPIESGLFRWCLEQGLRSLKPMNVMSRGEYREPQGSWFPSVLY